VQAHRQSSRKRVRLKKRRERRLRKKHQQKRMQKQQSRLLKLLKRHSTATAFYASRASNTTSHSFATM
jgi:hypothetical protein